MECNVGGTERALRAVVGTATLGVALLAPVDPRLRAAAAAVGLIEVVTAATRYCPLNTLLGRSSCRPATRWRRRLERLVA